MPYTHTFAYYSTTIACTPFIYKRNILPPNYCCHRMGEKRFWILICPLHALCQFIHAKLFRQPRERRRSAKTFLLSFSLAPNLLLFFIFFLLLFSFVFLLLFFFCFYLFSCSSGSHWTGSIVRSAFGLRLPGE